MKVLIEYGGKFLFIVHTYGQQKWTFPGGGLKRGESKEEAVRREVEEEVNIRLDKLIYLGSYESEHEFARHGVECFLAQVKTEDFRVDNLEIEKAGWFSVQGLPEPVSPAVERVLKLYLKYSGQRTS